MSALDLGRRKIENREMQDVAVGDHVLDPAGMEFEVVGFDSTKHFVSLDLVALHGQTQAKWIKKRTEHVRVRSNQLKKENNVTKVSDSETTNPYTPTIRKAVEVFPVFAPDPGVSLRVESTSGATIWLEMTIEEARTLRNSITDRILETLGDTPVIKDNGWKDNTASKPVSKYAPIEWDVGEFDTDRQQWPVVNNKSDATSWFVSEDNARAIVERLNSRPR